MPRFCRAPFFSVNTRFRFRQLPSEAIPDQALADDLRHRKAETVVVIHFLSIVVAVRLLVQITEQVKRFNRNIGATDAALHEAAEVLQAVCMDLSVNVFDRVIDDLMREV